MRVLITGGAGFIGANVALLLENKGANVFVLDDFSHANFKNLQGIKGEIICADVTNEKIFNKLPKLDAVIHAAAITDTTLQNNKEMLNVNFNGFKNVLHFCIKKGIKLIYASSAGVYGNGACPMKESQPLKPLNAYAYSKYLCDCFARKAMKEANSLIVGLRYFNVYGPGEHHKKKSSSMIYQLYCQIKEGKQARLFKYGEQKRDFIYVKDVARITTAALALKKSLILNAGTGAAHSFNEIVHILKRILKKRLKTVYFNNPYREVYQNYTQADISLLKKLNITSIFNLKQGVGDYVNNYLTLPYLSI